MENVIYAQVCKATLQYRAGLNGCKVDPVDVLNNWEAVSALVHTYAKMGELREALQWAKERVKTTKMELQFCIKETGANTFNLFWTGDHLVQLIASGCHDDAVRLATAMLEYREAVANLKQAKVNLSAV